MGRCPQPALFSDWRCGCRNHHPAVERTVRLPQPHAHRAVLRAQPACGCCGHLDAQGVCDALARRMDVCSAVHLPGDAARCLQDIATRAAPASCRGSFQLSLEAGGARVRVRLRLWPAGSQHLRHHRPAFGFWAHRGLGQRGCGNRPAWAARRVRQSLLDVAPGAHDGVARLEPCRRGRCVLDELLHERELWRGGDIHHDDGRVAVPSLRGECRLDLRHRARCPHACDDGRPLCRAPRARLARRGNRRRGGSGGYLAYLFGARHVC